MPLDATKRRTPRRTDTGRAAAPARASTQTARAQSATGTTPIARAREKDAFSTIPFGRDFHSAVRNSRSAAVALEALAHTDEVLRDVKPALLKDFAFMKRAVLANPFVLLNEGDNDWLRAQIQKALPPAMRKKLVSDPQVADALATLKADLARVPDLDPAMFASKRALFREVLRNRLDPIADDPRPVAVVIYPLDDHNGQFTHLSPELAVHHRLMFYRVARDSDAARAIDEATKNKPATLMVLGGHGSQQLMAFGADDPARMTPEMQRQFAELQKTAEGRARLDRELTRTNEDRYFDFTDADILKPLASRLAPGAELVLFSCSTGEGAKGAENLANFFHALFPHVNVVAPTEQVPNNGLYFDDQHHYLKPSFEHIGRAYRIAADTGRDARSRPARAHQLRVRR